MTTDEEPAGSAGLDRPGRPRLRKVVAASRREDAFDLQELLLAVVPDLDGDRPETWVGLDESAALVDNDVRLLHALQAEGLHGTLWTELSNRLARYGLSVMKAWIHSGEIYKRAKLKRRAVERARPPLSTEEAIAVAMDTVAEGIALFKKKGLEQRDWNPAGGARLSTYFIGSCVLCFPNVHRGQLTQRSRSDQDVFVSDFDLEFGASVTQSAEDEVVGRMGIVDTLRGGRRGRRGGYPDDVVNLVVLYHMEDYKSAEIAELISSESAKYSSSTVRKILAEYRKQAAKERREGDRA
ncbi:hypothetical protein SAMN05421837_12155 [Amycolatopsis pretoriensis]|uniref:Uncharacterized protein n=1 Tax=Amycolatopsis pretoriensis TaxID=218821 RepID=A0A1H5RK09_9PSEU|nr:hypothetical protein [Amycolatopsis pretoriensis]SEF38424.1 hypothetical protein SAMN05421837_12155 [Amycolatopsis pretoriensis]